MRIIKTFKWCKEYQLDKIEIDYDLNSENVIIYKAKKVRKIKHMIETIKWARQFTEYKHAFDRNLFYYVCKWLKYNWNGRKNPNGYLRFSIK